ncbi:hypothetical protein JYU34_016319 [Plutella xylostella]|uniref:Uncharacterized protein n=1 Tax=Plutella xylostella TaxID=51655 RepID=A0ABQ7Q2C0_PLUXY|nr:hypothetical protein JYU34_016319 [Plutella xylostella]
MSRQHGMLVEYLGRVLREETSLIIYSIRYAFAFVTHYGAHRDTSKRLVIAETRPAGVILNYAPFKVISEPSGYNIVHGQTTKWNALNSDITSERSTVTATASQSSEPT